MLVDRTEAFYAGIKAFAARNGIPVVQFASGQRKDDVMREHLAQFLAAGRTEGVVFIGRAQEKGIVWATTRRRDADGHAYPWIVRDSRVVTQWYFYCEPQHGLHRVHRGAGIDRHAAEEGAPLGGERPSISRRR